MCFQCPDNAGSSYYNYKNSHSIVLLGICDAQYLLTHVDIGAYGRRSDGGIFWDSPMGQSFHGKNNNIPNPSKLTVDGEPLPYVLVGDEAFQLTDYMLRPYPFKGGLNEDRKIFNYRLSRARRTIENVFGIMVSQWRLLKRPIDATVDNAMIYLQAITCLHNWLRLKDLGRDEYLPISMVDEESPVSHDGVIPEVIIEELAGSAFEDISTCGLNNSSRAVMAIRDEICDFFSSEGAVHFQYQNL